MVAYHGLEMYGFKDVKYYQIVRDLIEEFRVLFVEWVASFNQKHFIVDKWGLFNPPGISVDYVQLDDELNFLDEDDEDNEFS
jgi:superfamily I DNA and RNA helicase